MPQRNNPEKRPRLGPWQPKFRFVHINAFRPGYREGWVTIQFANLECMRYEEVDHRQIELLRYVAQMDMVMGSIGDSYSAWLPIDLIPAWVQRKYGCYGPEN